MFSGINPKQIQGMMKKMGISNTQINAKRVIIECEDKNIIIEPAEVVQIKMQGQESFQVSGEIREEELNESLFSEEDIQTVIEKTGKEYDEVKEALEKNEGDIASAILDLR
jgi:nascent polypeptide-associated complex subunit alpha